MKKILFISISILFLLSSCCRDEADRTHYLSPLQRSITNMYQTNDTFRMLRNETDTIEILVTSSNISKKEEGVFCNKHWFEKGWVFIKTPNEAFVNGEYIGVYANIQTNTENKENYVQIIFNSKSYRGEPILLGNKTIGSTSYSDIYYLIREDSNNNDTMYISLDKGFVSVKIDDEKFVKID